MSMNVPVIITETVGFWDKEVFIDNENISDVRIHSPKDEVEIKALRSFNEIHNLGVAIKDEFVVAMDIRDIPDQGERRRILAVSYTHLTLPTNREV